MMTRINTATVIHCFLGPSETKKLATKEHTFHAGMSTRILANTANMIITS